MPYAAAAGAGIGSWMLLPIPAAAAVALAGVCLWRPSPALVLAVFIALTSTLGTRAMNGLADPPTGTVDAWVTVLEDPRPLSSGGTRATVRHEGRRLEAQAFGMAAARLGGLLAGERVRLSGTVRPASGDWHRWRHVAGVLAVAEVSDTAPAAPLPGFANRIRHLLADGAESLSDDHRALFSGMVYGDDRNQSPRLADDFRAAGLGHLLVVSGQNVAFVLALASPLLTRPRPGVRLVVLLGVLGVFALLTRFEPSVLRAVAMAGVAVTSAALGRPEAGRRTLAWAIAAVLVLDPFLIRSLAFQLSVCATAGLLWITPALAEALRGPQVLRLAIATTAGAQLAVLPLLLAVFGTVPLASLPANLAAGPASAPVMMWGLTGGLGAGAAGGWLAWAAHRPTTLLLWWVRGVAATAAAAPPAVVGIGGGAVMGAGVVLVLAGRRLAIRGRTAQAEGLQPEQPADPGPPPGAGTVSSVLRTLGALMVTAVFVHSLLGVATPAEGWSELSGARIFATEKSLVVVLERPGSSQRLLQSLRTAGVRRVDLVVAASGGASNARAVLAVRDRFPTAAVVAPPMHRVPHARTVRTGDIVRIGATDIRIVAHDPTLAVEVAAIAEPGDKSDRGALRPGSLLDRGAAIAEPGDKSDRGALRPGSLLDRGAAGVEPGDASVGLGGTARLAGAVPVYSPAMGILAAPPQSALRAAGVHTAAAASAS